MKPEYSTSVGQKQKSPVTDQLQESIIQFDTEYEFSSDSKTFNSSGCYYDYVYI